MASYILRRIVLSALVLLGASVIVFFVTRLAPADPVLMAVGVDAPREVVERYRHEWGFDKPIWEQYLVYMRHVLQLDFGESLISGRSVIEDIKARWPATIELALVATLVYFLLGVLLGSVAGMTRSAHLDTAVRLLSVGAYSLPPFWVGLVLQILFFVQLGLLPAVGRIESSVAPPTQLTGLYLVDSLVTGNLSAFVSSLKCITMPATTLILSQAGLLVRMMRVSVLDVKGKPYVTTARSKGLREGVLYRRHILRNAILPVITMTGIQLGWLLTGTVVVEAIFAWPGLGRWAMNSIILFDYAPIMGLTLLATGVFLVMNLLVDILYTLVDPRIGYAS